MTHPALLPLEACEDRALAGGKAAGLHRLILHGFRIPPGICLTTALYEEALERTGIRLRDQWRTLQTQSERDRQVTLAACRRAIEQPNLLQAFLDPLEASLDELERDKPPGASRLWAVRSSASSEDGRDRSFAGMYRTVLGVAREDIPAAVVSCWASLWTETAFAYVRRWGMVTDPPKMAVIIQPLLSPTASGVAFSQDVATGRPDRVLVNAVLGLADVLVAGRIVPDHYVVVFDESKRTPAATVVERTIAEKPRRRVPVATGLRDEAVDEDERRKPALEDATVRELAALVKRVERALGEPVDVEWAIDRQGIWLLQARSLLPAGAPSTTASGPCEWSRANFKETMPELPSPLGLSLLNHFMEHQILKPYRQAGCKIPEHAQAVRIVRGRPYINVTLFQTLTAQLGGDPRDVAEQMGGHGGAPPVGAERLPWWTLLWAGGLFLWKMQKASRRAPTWFAEMKQMATDLHADSLKGLRIPELLARMDRIGMRLQEHDLTFAIVAGAGQALRILGLLLSRAIGEGWRGLLNAALQGQGTVISARQVLWLAELANQARQEDRAQAFFLADPWTPDRFRSVLAGTRFLKEFDRFLAEFGHRALGESDVAVPRFSEQPDYLLGVIRAHLQATGGKSVEEILWQQESARKAALAEIRRRIGWRLHNWIAFRWWYRRLCRFLALREANRHHLMYFSAAMRLLALVLGEQLSAAGVLETPHDIFLLTAEEIRAIARNPSQDWKSLIAGRRTERKEHATYQVPDTIRDDGWERDNAARQQPPRTTSIPLSGTPVSTGYAEGLVCLLLSPDEFRKVKRGDIIVAPVLDPGMAPVFSLAAGLVAEMGGTLSHGAIIAREYGLPTVVNVLGVTKLLKDGEHIAVDATRGLLWPLGPS